MPRTSETVMASRMETLAKRSTTVWTCTHARASNRHSNSHHPSPHLRGPSVDAREAAAKVANAETKQEGVNAAEEMQQRYAAGPFALTGLRSAEREAPAPLAIDQGRVYCCSTVQSLSQPSDRDILEYLRLLLPCL